MHVEVPVRLRVVEGASAAAPVGALAAVGVAAVAENLTTCITGVDVAVS